VDNTDLSHLLFRGLHVVTGVMWVGLLWSLAWIQRLPIGRPVDPGVAAMALRSCRSSCSRPEQRCCSA
jgi:hypothetical protein